MVVRFLLLVMLACLPTLQASAQSDALGDLIEAPRPQEKPGREKGDANTGAPVAETVARPQKATPSLASQLKACPALVSGRVEGRYLPANLTDEQCGDEAPLELTAIGQVKLEPPVQLNCRMTNATANWVERVSQISVALLGKSLDTVQTASSYVCRRRNNARDGKFSEHATMNAVDVSGFTLEEGEAITILNDWPLRQPSTENSEGQQSRTRRETHPSTSKARFLRAAHAQACQNFTTVLGPDGDAFHQNHFHLDLGCHGQSCNFRICQ